MRSVEYLGIPLAEGLAEDLGRRCMDVDAHEMTPAHLWREAFGAAGLDAIDLWASMPALSQEGENSNNLTDDDVVDDMQINENSVWNVRGIRAPGAFDFRRRVEVNDQMGIARQLVFPTFGNFALVAAVDPGVSDALGPGTLPIPKSVDAVRLTRDLIAGHNDWVLRMTKVLPVDRLRLVAIVMTDSLDQMIADARFFLGQGVRALCIPCGVPPGGLSPADLALDPFYALFEEYDAALTIHVGTEYPFLRSRVWDTNVPVFEASRTSLAEFPMQPYWGATVGFPIENFLTVMILGGVFERHTTLRVGALEMGAQWLGPLMERLDLWANQFKSRLSSVLSMSPSAYLDRHVRVAPYTFEDVALYFQRYPQISHSFCYFSDYPHREGGMSSKATFLKKLAPLGESTIRKFFIENGELLLPN
jgi:hypothetical protein